MAVGIVAAATTIIEVFVVALSLARSSRPFALDVVSAGVLITETSTFLFTTVVFGGPHALTVVLATRFSVVAVEALEEAQSTTIGVEFAAGVVHTDVGVSVGGTLHQAAVVVGVPNAHGISSAVSLITFIFALSAADGVGRIPHAAVVAVAGS